MKKGFWNVFLFWLLIGILLGCTAVPISETKESATTLPNMLADQETEPVDIRPSTAKDPGSSFCDYDPNREIYILGEDLHEEIFAWGGQTYIQFRLFSKHEVDTEKIDVQLSGGLTGTLKRPVKKVPLNDSTEANSTLTFGRVDNNVSLMYYTYLSYRIPNGPFASDDSSLVEDFLALTQEDIPDFHVYILTYILDVPEDIADAVRIEYADITIEGQTHRVELAEVWLRPKSDYYEGMAYKSGMPDPTRFPEFIGGASVQGIQLCNEGYIQLYSLYSFEKIQGTLVLSNFRLTDPDAVVLDLIVSQTSASGSMLYSWDGKSPIHLYAGDSIDITLRYYDPDMAGFWSRDVLRAIVDATVDGEPMCVSSERRLEAGNNYYEQYAIIFDGVDVEPYYRDYYYPYYDAWRKEYQ